MSAEHGAWQTVYHRFPGVFEQLIDGLITEAAEREQVDMSLASVNSTVGRAHTTLPAWAYG